LHCFHHGFVSGFPIVCNHSRLNVFGARIQCARHPACAQSQIGACRRAILLWTDTSNCVKHTRQLCGTDATPFAVEETLSTPESRNASGQTGARRWTMHRVLSLPMRHPMSPT